MTLRDRLRSSSQRTASDKFLLSFSLHFWKGRLNKSFFHLFFLVRNINLYCFTYEFCEFGIYLLKVGFEAWIIVISIRKPKQLIKVRGQEVLQMLAPPLNQRLYLGAVCSIWHPSDPPFVD